MQDWPGWRGPRRDGTAAWLPERLAAEPKVLWRKTLAARGIGGVAATERRVIVSDRELNDTTDVFRCLDADSGNELWAVRYYAPAKLDYGNSPRATPLIAGDRVFLYGAMGHLTCAELSSGRVIWRLNVRDEFDVTAKLPWGLCGSPLIEGGRLIVNPGGEEGSLVALDPADGKPLWTARGEAAGYGSLIAATLGGRRQIVGHDALSLGGWDATTGERLWKVVPEWPNDFNVPTPIVADGRLIVMTENNGTRVFGFGDGGRIDPTPMTHLSEIAPDTHSPVAVGDRLFVVWQGLHCLALSGNLQEVWKASDKVFERHTSLMASTERVLVLTHDAELLLIDGRAAEYRLLGRQRVLPEETGLLSHPALLGRKLFVRGNSEIVCVALE